MPKEQERQEVAHIEASERAAGKSPERAQYIARAKVYGLRHRARKRAHRYSQVSGSGLDHPNRG
jgi:hypothetical protein